MNRLLISLLLLSIPASALARTPNDPEFGQQWYLEKISAEAAWDVAVGSREVVVAVLDSGVDLDHPDLADNLWSNAGEIADNGKDDDGNGFADDAAGWDFVDDDGSPTPSRGGAFADDAVAHGTVISGLIGAVGNNGEGVAGVNWRVRIMPLRILDNVGSGESNDAREAIRYAINNGADVINLSFVGYQIDPSFEDAVGEAYAAGIPVIAAVGNQDGGGIDLDETPVYPACFEGEKADWVIGVAATDEGDAKADFSNYGADCTDVSAPGTDVYGTMYQNAAWEDFPDAYRGGWSGTSVAAPLVTGAVALLSSAYPTLTPTLMRTVLQLSADPLHTRGTAAAGKLGAGRLNVARALEIAPAFVPVVDERGAGTPPLTATEGPSPVTGLMEPIDAVAVGSFIRSPGFETVYFVGSDGKRHPLWDRQTFFTWNDSWDDVTWVTDATLPTLPLGEALPPKPGVVLVKVQSDPRVYAAESGGDPWRATLREIAAEEVAAATYGALWQAYVIDVEPTLFSHYERGETIVSVEPVDLGSMKTRESLE